MSDANNCTNRAGKYRSRGNGRKRKRENREESVNLGVGSTLGVLQQPDIPEFNLTTEIPASRLSRDLDNDVQSPNLGEWEMVEGQRRKRSKKIPKANSSNYPAIIFSPNSNLQSQIKISDLQGLVLYLLADGTSPQWISVRNRSEIRKVVVLMVPGLERNMFSDGASSKEIGITENGKSESNERGHTSPDTYYPVKLVLDNLPPQLKSFVDIFEHLWPVKTPGDDKYNKMHSPLHAMLTAPLPKSQEEKRKKGVQSAREPQGWKNKRTRITEYILSPEELLENDYILHPAMYSDQDEISALLYQRKRSETLTEHGWVETNVDTYEDGCPPESEIEQGSLTAGREVVAMDCEMCMTGENEFSLTRISLVSWDGSVILDELVKPDKPIVDYVTMYSGIDEAMLAPITTTLHDVQQKLIKILHPKTILVGHSLNADLTALKLTHPFIIDTALLYPHPRGPPLKSSLKYLAQKYLGREIQKGHGSSGPGAGHDSIEDARTCLDLVKQKCEKGPAWGTSDSQGENLFKRLARTGVRYKSHGGSVGQSTGRSSAAVDWGDPKKSAGAAADVIIGCKSDEEVMQGVIRAVKGDLDGLEVQGGGVDFVWARMRELESLKGWWNNNKSFAAEAATSETATTKSTPAGKGSVGVTTDDIENPPNDEVITSDAINSNKETSPADNNALEPNASVLLSPQQTLLEAATAMLTSRIHTIYESLPPCTAYIVYSGSGDPQEMSRLQAIQQTFKREFKVKKWDQLTVKWTDAEEQALKRAARQARDGIGFMCVK